MTHRRHFVLAAGGTGGHMTPAQALASELLRRGHAVTLITDERGAKIPGLFAHVPVHIIPAGRMTKNPLGWLKVYRTMRAGVAMARAIYDDMRPDAVIGFGGYPAFPALWAAQRDGIATAIHEQNAVLGRVNRLVAGRVSAIATSYPVVKRLKAKYYAKAYLVGNPVRDEVIALRQRPFPDYAAQSVLRILVTGGSLGASILSQIVPEALAMLPDAIRQRVQVVQQCRAEDIETVRARYRALNIPAELASYMEDLPARLAWSHLVIARAGASTIAELTVIGRPSILIPLPIAADDHQTANAMELAETGGAISIPQPQFTPSRLVEAIMTWVENPDDLADAAGRARQIGRPDAARVLADLVESLDRPYAPEMVGTAPSTSQLAGAGA